MTPKQPLARTTGSADFDPEKYFQNWSRELLPQHNDLQTSLKKSFSLPRNDNYVYHAIASVTLSQVQDAISIGGEHGLHAWYLDGTGQPVKYLHFSLAQLSTSLYVLATTTTCWRHHRLYGNFQCYEAPLESPRQPWVEREEKLSSSPGSQLPFGETNNRRKLYNQSNQEAPNQSLLRLLGLVMP